MNNLSIQIILIWFTSKYEINILNIISLINIDGEYHGRVVRINISVSKIMTLILEVASKVFSYGQLFYILQIKIIFKYISNLHVNNCIFTISLFF